MRAMIELISVHIPKTGGTTVGRLLRDHYGHRLDQIYPPPREAPIFWRARLRLTRTIRHRRPFRRAVHGHFQASRFAPIDAPMIAFIRDPLKMQISLWHFARRIHPERRGPYGRVSMTMPLDEWIEYPAPMLTSYLDVPINRLALIGTDETYEADLRCLCAMIGARYEPRRENANPEGSNYSITPDMRRRYERVNAAESELYEAARAARSTA